MHSGLLATCAVILGCGASTVSQNVGEQGRDASVNMGDADHRDAGASDVVSDHTVMDVEQPSVDPTGLWACPVEAGFDHVLSLRVTRWERGVIVTLQGDFSVVPPLLLIAHDGDWRLETAVPYPIGTDRTGLLEEAALRLDPPALRLNVTFIVVRETGPGDRRQQAFLCYRVME